MMLLVILEVAQGKMIIFGFLRDQKRVVESSGSGVSRFSDVTNAGPTTGEDRALKGATAD